MTLAVVCACSNRYTLKDEFAGQLLQCPACGQTMRASAALTPASQADPAFDRDVFLLRQKALAINAKYHVYDEAGAPILFVERPTHLLRNLAALIGGVLAGLITAAAIAGVASLGGEAARDIGAIVAFVGFWAALIVVGALLSKKRHVTMYRSEARTERLLDVLQDRKLEILTATYTVRDAAGRPLALLRKNYLYNIVRKRWVCRAPDGRLLCVAKEDSIILSLLRRVLGPMFGLLRTNFLFLGEREEPLGEFKRKLTILDRYVLDLNGDRRRALDRRVALALGVMLDTGERR